MLARCARCQGTFTTDRYGRQFCPHCGSELILPDPNAAQPTAPAGGGQDAPPGEGAPLPEGGAPAWSSPPSPPTQGGAGGTVPPPPPAGGGWAPIPPPPPSPPSDDGIPAPFADRAGRGFFAAFVETFKLAATEPQKFFMHVRIQQIWPAVLFGVLAGWVGAAVAAIFGWLGGAAWTNAMRQLTQNMPSNESEMIQKFAFALGGGAAAFRILLAPVGIFIFIFATAAILHLVLMMFQGAARGFNATLTVVAYSSGVQLLNAVPGCGGLIAMVWQVVLLIIGLAAVHRTTTGKAALAVLLPGFLCCCCLCVGIWGTVAAIMGAASSGAGGTSNL